MPGRRVAGAALIALLLIAAVRVTSTYRVFSQTIDEPIHVAAGFQWLTTDRYDLDLEHPPLARILFAIDPWLDGVGKPAGDRVEQGNALLYRDDRYRHHLALARAGNLIWLLLALGVVFAWTKRLAGTAAAMLAVALLGALPPVLGHAGLATTDMAVAAATVAALFLFDRWLDEPTWTRAIVLGLVIGAGLLTKFSFPLFFPLGVLCLLRRTRIRVRQAAVAGSIAILLVWAGYKFEATRLVDHRLANRPPVAPEHVAAKYSRVPGYEWVRPDLIERYRRYGELGAVNVDFVDWAKAAGYPSPLAGRHGDTMANAPPLPPVSFRDRVLEPLHRVGQWMALRVPLPATAFFRGIQLVRVHARLGHSAYLFGEHRHEGWWYYFPVVLFFKTPLPFLILAIIGLATLRRGIALAPLLMLAAAMTSRINIGVRHILPLFPLLAILAGVGAMVLWRRSRIAAVALLLWYFIATAIAHPDYLAYFNELAGRHPERIASDSNLDWGQDLLRLADVARRENLDPLYVSYFGSTDWLRHLPHARPLPPTPVSGWVAVSEEHYIRRLEDDYPWLAQHEPVRQIGTSIRLYRIVE